jgi:hypothetical protein
VEIVGLIILFMDNKLFAFEDHAENYYSAVTQERFYDVVAKKEQLTRLLLTPESLKLLQKESKQYQRNMYMTAGGSLVMLYPLNRLFSFGGGFTNRIGQTLLSLVFITAPLFYVNYTCKESMKSLKSKIYSENRAAFRKYELTGDILQANDHVLLVE